MGQIKHFMAFIFDTWGIVMVRHVPSSAAACFIVATSSGVSLHLGVETVMLVSWNMRKPKQVIP